MRDWLINCQFLKKVSDTVNGASREMWKETAVVNSKVLCLNLYGETGRDEERSTSS